MAMCYGFWHPQRRKAGVPCGCYGERPCSLSSRGSALRPRASRSRMYCSKRPNASPGPDTGRGLVARGAGRSRVARRRGLGESGAWRARARRLPPGKRQRQHRRARPSAEGRADDLAQPCRLKFTRALPPGFQGRDTLRPNGGHTSPCLRGRRPARAPQPGAARRDSEPRRAPAWLPARTPRSTA